MCERQIKSFRYIDRRSLQKSSETAKSRRGDQARRDAGAALCFRGLHPVYHGSRLFAEPESCQAQRRLGLFLRLSSCLGCASGPSSFVCSEIDSANTATSSGLHIPNCRLRKSMFTPLWVDAASEIACFDRWNKCPSCASTRDGTQWYAGRRKLQQPAWHGSLYRQVDKLLATDS